MGIVLHEEDEVLIHAIAEWLLMGIDALELEALALLCGLKMVVKYGTTQVVVASDTLALVCAINDRSLSFFPTGVVLKEICCQFCRGFFLI